MGRAYSSKPEGKIVLGRVNRRLETVNFYLTEVRDKYATLTDQYRWTNLDPDRCYVTVACACERISISDSITMFLSTNLRQRERERGRERID